jgi:L,D-transpeptidase ErfK/SrfK
LPVQKVATAEVEIPRRGELPGVIGRLQWHTIQPKETLLDTARNCGLGFNEVADANPGVDEWIPSTGTSVLVPSMWILPRSHYRGLVINVAEMRMYLYPAKTSPGDRVPVRTWPIGIGTEERNSPIGSFHVTSMDANPTWFVPDSIYKTMDPPRRRVVPPGPDNPLGTHRIRLSLDIYSIHGTDTPWSIGRLTTHGCIRLYPEDIPDLYKRLKPGARGELVYQPVKIGEADGHVLLEVHPDVYGRTGNLEKEALRLLKDAKLESRVDPKLVRAVAKSKSGVPVDVTRGASFEQAGVFFAELIEPIAPARKQRPRSRADL